MSLEILDCIWKIFFQIADIEEESVCGETTQLESRLQELTCECCRKKFPSEHHLQHHINYSRNTLNWLSKTSHRRRNWSKVSKSKNELYVHNDNDRKKKVACKVCKKYISVNYLPRHLRAYHSSYFKCEFEGCSKIFSSKNSRKKHTIDEHRSNFEFRCSECKKICKNKMAMRIHKHNNHSEIPKYICKIDGCGYKTMLRHCMRQHYEAAFNHNKFNITRSVLNSLIDELK